MPSGMTRPEIDCEGCGRTHLLSPAAMAVALLAFQSGDMQHVTRGGTIVPVCLLAALDMMEFTERYRYRSVDARTIDRQISQSTTRTEVRDETAAASIRV